MKKILFYNLANILTGLRILCTFILVYFVQRIFFSPKAIGVYIGCFSCIAVICISDFFDGKIARRFNISSSFGAAFDVCADVLFVFLIHIQLAYYQILPVWFLFFMAEKILNYILTSRLLSKREGEQFKFIRDPVGRIVSASYFFTPLLFLVVYCFFPQGYEAASVIIAILACLGIWSSVYRLYYLIQAPITVK